ncbi:hypothetical protein [Limimaricola litoreus]|uniref:Uncharacterized protein n=1 Tax=Limimaricola litoreus TaxID=2955316 RepID=A0A9X2JQA0_9RHOB|nr:hypothetical protein [Limimaricola litoreus]MCP1167356.1 hypothetical protein [Limimaricola litoreus]
MCERCHDCDSLIVRINRALDAAEATEAALAAAEKIQGLSVSQQRRAAMLRQELAQATIFSALDIDAFRVFAADLDAAIRQGTGSHYIADEYAISGGYEQHVTNESAMALIALQSALNLLARRIGAVRNRLRAERIASELRVLKKHGLETAPRLASRQRQSNRRSL